MSRINIVGVGLVVGGVHILILCALRPVFVGYYWIMCSYRASPI